MSRYEEAKKIYDTLGIDTEAALETLKNVPISLHCWQGDDVIGFDNDGALSGGIQTTGNYPGRARTPEELMADMNAAAGKARMKGAKDVVMIGKDAAFIVNVPNNMVVTAMSSEEMKENIFTNIDSAVLL